jgi:plastocyanin
MNPSLAKAVFGIGVALAIASIVSIYVTMLATQNQSTTQTPASQQSTFGSTGTTAHLSSMNQKTSDTTSKGINSNASSSVTTTILIPQGAAAQQIQTYYQPNPAKISSGQKTITWINKDSAPHTATALDNSFDTGIINVGSSGPAMIKGNSVSSIQYHCTIHPWMTGTLIH